MKILIYCPSFYPNIGGLETIIESLAYEFIDQGHAVKLISLTSDANNKIFPFQVIRCPQPYHFLNLTHWCDVFFQGCVSLKGLWPNLLIRRPLIITHQTWYCRSDGSHGWQDHLKHIVTKFATNISVSYAISQSLSVPSTIIPNSYRNNLFYEMPEIPRLRDLVFLGRLVSDKGVNLVLDSLVQLQAIGWTPSLTIIGQGPEEETLRQQTKAKGVADQVEFLGSQVGLKLTQLLNEHRIMVVPSLWNEPFGIVALEGIACGCVVVGSEGGGLKDAIGHCGVTFPNGDGNALTAVIADLLTHPDKLAGYRANAPAHLAHHHPSFVARSYLEVMEATVS